jgi:hypothetical protein
MNEQNTNSNIVPPVSIEDILNGQRPKMVGVLEFGHKTGGFLVMMTEEQRKELNRKTRRHTYGSNLGRIMG